MTPPPSLPLDVFDALRSAMQAYIWYLEAGLADLGVRVRTAGASGVRPAQRGVPRREAGRRPTLPGAVRDPDRPGRVCDFQRKTAAALEPVAREAHAHVAGRPATEGETGWREGRKRGWLWVAVTTGVTVFLVRMSRAQAVLTNAILAAMGLAARPSLIPTGG